MFLEGGGEEEGVEEGATGIWEGRAGSGGGAEASKKSGRFMDCGNEANKVKIDGIMHGKLQSCLDVLIALLVWPLVTEYSCKIVCVAGGKRWQLTLFALHAEKTIIT